MKISGLRFAFGADHMHSSARALSGSSVKLLCVNDVPTAGLDGTMLHSTLGSHMQALLL